MKLPNIEYNKFGVICCEKKTGVVLDLDLTRFLRKGNIPIRIFSSKNEILEFIESIQMDDIEYLIYDHNHSLIELNKINE